MLKPTPRPIRVVIADGCSVMRTGLIQTIEAEPQLRVVASTAHHHDLCHCLRTVPADVLVLDPVRLGDAPVPLLRAISQAYPRLRIVVFSAAIDFVSELLVAGAHAVVAQQEADDQLRLAIRAVQGGQRFLSPLVQDYVDRYALPTTKNRLDPAELRCLMYIAQGLDNQDIAARMDVALRTIENRVSNIRAKTGCATRVQMAAWYTRLYGNVGAPMASLRLPSRTRMEQKRKRGP
jgi:two-component system response regulator DesR